MRDHQFCYNNMFSCMPETFAFPRETTHMNRWGVWLCGKVVVHNNVMYKIKPFCSLYGHDLLSKSLEGEFTTKWQSIFKMMEDAPTLSIPVEVDEAFV